MKEYDKMLAGEYWVADQRMMELQELELTQKNTMQFQTQTMKKNWLA